MRYQVRQAIVDTAVDAGAVARQGSLGTPRTLVHERELTGGQRTTCPDTRKRGGRWMKRAPCCSHSFCGVLRRGVEAREVRLF